LQKQVCIQLNLKKKEEEKNDIHDACWPGQDVCSCCKVNRNITKQSPDELHKADWIAPNFNRDIPHFKKMHAKECFLTPNKL